MCVDDTLVGLVTIETLLGADEHLLLEEVMEPDPPRVGPGADQEVAAWKMIHRGESSLAVVDGQDRFVGLIPPTQMLEVLLREHEEDLRRLGGFLHDTAQARLASREAIGRRLMHRLPWLVVGLAGALASAVLLRSFEARLADRVSLAFFIPGIVYLAGAVGTQTETLVVRGLSVGVSVRSIIRGRARHRMRGGIAAGGHHLPVRAGDRRGGVGGLDGDVGRVGVVRHGHGDGDSPAAGVDCDRSGSGVRKRPAGDHRAGSSVDHGLPGPGSRPGLITAAEAMRCRRPSERECGALLLR